MAAALGQSTSLLGSCPSFLRTKLDEFVAEVQTGLLNVPVKETGARGFLGRLPLD